MKSSTRNKHFKEDAANFEKVGHIKDLKSVDVIIQFYQLLYEAFIWCYGPFAPGKK